MIFFFFVGVGLVVVPSLIYCLMPGASRGRYIAANYSRMQSVHETQEISRMLKQHMFNSTFGIYHSGDRHVSDQIQRPHDWNNSGNSGPFAN